MSLSTLIAELRHGWKGYRDLKKTSKAEAIFQLVVESFPEELRTHLIPSPRYTVEGSTGRGNITAAPWVATYDLRITHSATEGFYLVYLFSVDMNRLYLSLAFGTTQFAQYFKESEERHNRLSSAAVKLRSLATPSCSSRYHPRSGGFLKRSLAF